MKARVRMSEKSELRLATLFSKKNIQYYQIFFFFSFSLSPFFFETICHLTVKTMSSEIAEIKKNYIYIYVWDFESQSFVIFLYPRVLQYDKLSTNHF